MNRQFPVLTGNSAARRPRLSPGMPGAWIGIVGVGLGLAAQGTLAATTGPAELLAQFDAVASFCSEVYPDQAVKLRDLFGALLSNASNETLREVRDSAEFRRLFKLDLNALEKDRSGSIAGACAAVVG